MSNKAFPLQEVLRWAAGITGKSISANRTELVDLVRETLEVLHLEESLDTLRKWCIPSCGCLVTIPREMEAPLKYKIGAKVGPVRSFTYQFHGYTRHDCQGYNSDLRYHSETPLFFDLPADGARVAVRALEEFSEDSRKRPYLLVQGTNTAGQIVTHTHEDKGDVGERVYVAQPHESPEYSHQVFKKITSVRVVNCDLNLMLVWCNVDRHGEIPREYGILSIYDRGEEYPTFRRYQLPPVIDASCCYEIEVLGHLRPPALVYDNELIRGYDSGIIRSMLRSKHHQSSNNLEQATYNSNMAMSNLRKQNDKKMNETDAIDIFAPTAPGNFPRNW